MIVVVLLKFLLVTGMVRSSFCSCKKDLRNMVIPKFADGFKTTKVDVFFDDRRVECGGTVQLAETIKAPTLKLGIADRCPYITLISFTTNAALGGVYLRWMVINIPSSDMKEGFNNGGGPLDKGKNGDVKASYVAQKDSQTGQKDPTTIVYLIYCQCHYNPDKEPYAITERIGFDVKGYADDNGLYCPLAGYYTKAILLPVPVTTPLDLPPVQAPIPPAPLPPPANQLPA